MKLSSLLSDGLILQQGRENRIWASQCQALEELSVILSEGDNILSSATGKADEKGYFDISLPAVPKGGPYNIRIEGNESVVINDVYSGDVFLLAGQSNMELPLSRCMDLYEDEINEMNLPDIHFFEVPKEHAFDGPEDEIYGGCWQVATQPDIKKMSALGIFFARLHKRKHNVPVGLVQTAVGGTHIESYLSEESIHVTGSLLRKLALEKGEDISGCSCNNNNSCKVCYEERLIRNKDKSYVEKINSQDAARSGRWFSLLEEMDTGRKEHWETGCFGNSEKRFLRVPGMWENLSDNKELETLRGCVWASKDIEIKREWLDKEIRLYLGTIMDSDETYVNGILVGRTEYRYPPRRYRIPAGLLKEGMNNITVRVTAYARSGGFVPEMPYCLSVDGHMTDTVSLEGNWRYAVGANKTGIVSAEELEMKDGTFFNWQPTAMYNQMVYPVRRLSYKGMLFYQGENNVSHTWEYEYLLIQMIKDFRNIIDENLPVGIVKLPKFGGEDEYRGTDTWEKIREAQQRAADKTDNCVIADIYNLGFKYELHPQTKKEAAEILYNKMSEII